MPAPEPDPDFTITRTDGVIDVGTPPANWNETLAQLAGGLGGDHLLLGEVVPQEEGRQEGTGRSGPAGNDTNFGEAGAPGLVVLDALPDFSMQDRGWQRLPHTHG